MTELVAVDFEAEKAAELFTKSLHETGFGVLKNHPIQKQLVETIYQEWEEWFKGDENDKEAYLYNKETQDGFFPSRVSETAKGHKHKDIKEYYHVYPNGRCPESLEKHIRAYYKEAGLLAQTLLSWVEAYSPPDIAAAYSSPLPEMIKESHKTLLRILHYPPMTGDEEPGAIRAAAHGDINLLTVLPAANEPGLQVQRKDGSWMDAPSDFGLIIVNIGDMLQEASQGYYPSTIHRVINPSGKASDKSRISLPLFLHPRPDVVLSERHTADTYLEERLRELGVK
ncbi:2OG-Fe(II) oxygenase family protein [Temperatibacter marinus]|uniref:2-oxoglutarate-dependent ethylene/succinate-forming enzyme n=1 Tax=Temperatibacter marinus TaxID=1456591 RepID=A0AA52HAY1_9PROT|nr:2OG-Fe(II) oxygenase family protein [Temperatibacter marinus]WND03083.1 2OG-Fe(II) oxygenase family protein [Temperatibacter marinus]